MEEELEVLKKEIIEMYDDIVIEDYNDGNTEFLEEIKTNVSKDGFDLDFNLRVDEKTTLLEKMYDSDYIDKYVLESFKKLLYKTDSFVINEKTIYKIKRILISRNNKTEILHFV